MGNKLESPAVLLPLGLPGEPTPSRLEDLDVRQNPGLPGRLLLLRALLDPHRSAAPAVRQRCRQDCAGRKWTSSDSHAHFRHDISCGVVLYFSG